MTKGDKSMIKIARIEDAEAIIHLVTASEHHDGYGVDKIQKESTV